MSARPGPCGGHRVTGVPTAIVNGGRDAHFSRPRERAGVVQIRIGVCFAGPIRRNATSGS